MSTRDSFVELSEWAVWSQCQQKVETEHRGGKDERKHHKRFQQKLPSPGRCCQPIGDRQSDNEQDRRCRSCQLQGQQYCLPVQGDLLRCPSRNAAATFGNICRKPNC